MTTAASTTAVIAWTNWIASQPVSGWYKVTLEYHRWNKRQYWQRAVMHTFRELEQRSFSRKRKKEFPRIIRVVVFGGDTKAGIELHVHCLVENVIDENIFRQRLNLIWKRNVRKVVQHNGYDFDEKEARAWVGKADDSAIDYLLYTTRREGVELNFGLEKFDPHLSYLVGMPKSSFH
jgi:hypothetical protein